MHPPICIQIIMMVLIIFTLNFQNIFCNNSDFNLNTFIWSIDPNTIDPNHRSVSILENSYIHFFIVKNIRL